jgi:ABC-type antimicrobial peptide transport system permease subunit
LEIRTVVDPASVIAAVRHAVATAAPGLPVESIETMEARFRQGLGQERLVVLLTSSFGALALALAGFGLFGVLSYSVARRTPELGLRMALGAPRSRVLRGVVQDALWLVLCGILLGLPIVFLGARLAATMIFGVSPHDWATLVAAPLVLVACGALCSVSPALRASRIDPMVALRQE